jgi:hypothetical protein
MRRVHGFIIRTIRATTHLARDARVPRPLRWIAGVGLLPIPGPVDEALLLLVAPILIVFYRGAMRDAWHEASRRTRD